MLGVAAVTGALLLVGQKLDEPVEPVQDTEDVFSRIKNLFADQFDAGGLIAPSSTALQGRVPWNPDHMPFTFYMPGTANDFKVSDLYRNYLNTSDHYHRQTINDIHGSRLTFPHKTGGALVTAYSREFYTPDGRRTDFTNTSYYSRDPGAMDMMLSDSYARDAPKNHRIGADAYYWTEPGLPFRYGASK